LLKLCPRKKDIILADFWVFFHKDGKSFATSLLGENKIRVSPAFEENSGIIVIL
jgi:hypothetical protein